MVEASTTLSEGLAQFLVSSRRSSNIALVPGKRGPDPSTATGSASKRRQGNAVEEGERQGEPSESEDEDGWHARSPEQAEEFGSTSNMDMSTVRDSFFFFVTDNLIL